MSLWDLRRVGRITGLFNLRAFTNAQTWRYYPTQTEGVPSTGTAKWSLPIKAAGGGSGSGPTFPTGFLTVSIATGGAGMAPVVAATVAMVGVATGHAGQATTAPASMVLVALSGTGTGQATTVSGLLALSGVKPTGLAKAQTAATTVVLGGVKPGSIAAGGATPTTITLGANAATAQGAAGTTPATYTLAGVLASGTAKATATPTMVSLSGVTPSWQTSTGAAATIPTAIAFDGLAPTPYTPSAKVEAPRVGGSPGRRARRGGPTPRPADVTVPSWSTPEPYPAVHPRHRIYRLPIGYIPGAATATPASVGLAGIAPTPFGTTAIGAPCRQVASGPHHAIVVSLPTPAPPVARSAWVVPDVGASAVTLPGPVHMVAVAARASAGAATTPATFTAPAPPRDDARRARYADLDGRTSHRLVDRAATLAHRLKLAA